MKEEEEPLDRWGRPEPEKGMRRRLKRTERDSLGPEPPCVKESQKKKRKVPTLGMSLPRSPHKEAGLGDDLLTKAGHRATDQLRKGQGKIRPWLLRLEFEVPSSQPIGKLESKKGSVAPSRPSKLDPLTTSTTTSHPCHPCRQYPGSVTLACQPALRKQTQKAHPEGFT